MFWNLYRWWHQRSGIVDETQLRARFQWQVALVGMTAFAAVMAALFHLRMFVGLDVEAMDCAQLARNIAAGHGFTTSFVRPFMLALVKGHSSVPEVSNAPLYPLLLACVFVIRQSDQVVSAVTNGLFILSAPLLFVLAHRLTRKVSTASLTVAVYALCTPVLRMADSGRPLMLSAVLLLLLLLVLSGGETPRSPAARQVAERQGGKQQGGKRQANPALLLGVLCGLAYLTDYASVLYTLPITIVWLLGSGRWNRRALLGLAGGFVATSLLWWIRNTLVAHNPFYSLQWLELLSQRSDFPGAWSIYRDPNVSFAPGLTPFVLFWGIVPSEKTLQYAEAYYSWILSLPHLYLSVFVVAAYWLASELRQLRLLMKCAAIALFVYLIGMALLGRPDLTPGVFSSQNALLYVAPLAGLFILIGVTTFVRLLEEATDRWAQARAQDPEGRSASPQRAALRRILLIAALLVIIGFQPMVELATGVPNRQNVTRDLVTKTERALPKTGAIVTDIPWAIAWYANKTAIWIPTNVPDLPQLQKVLPVGGLYLSSAVMAYPQAEHAQDWESIYQQGPPLAGYTAVAMPVRPALARIYSKDPSLEDAEKAAAAHPDDPEAEFALGKARATSGDFKGAMAPLLRAEALRPRWINPYLIAAQASGAARDYATASAQYEKAQRVDPSSLDAARGVAEMELLTGQTAKSIALYERILADVPNDPTAINNLAYLYAETDQRPARALEMARRAAQAIPTNGEVLDTLGWVLLKAGRVNEALAQLQTAARLAPNNGAVYYHLGKALVAAGKAGDADAAFRSALDKGGISPAEQQDARSHIQQ